MIKRLLAEAVPRMIRGCVASRLLKRLPRAAEAAEAPVAPAAAAAADAMLARVPAAAAGCLCCSPSWLCCSCPILEALTASAAAEQVSTPVVLVWFETGSTAVSFVLIRGQ
jgi:hypothetical protein